MTIDPQTEADVDTVADRAGLRERIAAAIWERQNPGRRWADCEYRWRADAEEDADAVLSVLPPAADRAAEWRAAAVFVEAMNEACDNRRPCESCTTREDVAAELRHVADEERDEQQAQQGGERRVYAWAQTIDTTNGGNTIHLPGIHHGGSGPEETALVVSREDVPVLAAMLAEAQQDGPEAGTTADKAEALGMTPTEYRAHCHREAEERIRTAARGLYADAGFRVLAALDLSDGPVRCPLCPYPVTLHTPNGARAHFTHVHPEQRLVGPGPWPLLANREEPAAAPVAGQPPADTTGEEAREEIECANCWRVVENRSVPNMGGPSRDNWVHVPGGFQPCFPQRGADSPRAEPELTVAPQPETVHGCPSDGSGLTPCCGRTPFELPLTDRISSEAPVTCTTPPAVVAEPGKGPS